MSDQLFSLDVRAMVRPAAAFRMLAERPARPGLWTGLRRPLFLTAVLGCLVSLMTSGMLTLRVAGSAATYWSFVPAVEVLALLIVLRPRPGALPISTAVDAFLSGHAAWTLTLIGLAATWAFVPPWIAWTAMLRVWVWIALVALGWSLYVDFCFFRHLAGVTRSGAIVRVALHRALVWPIVFAVFALPAMAPWSIAQNVAEIFR
jgi:hypothetical protein